uniref:Uncharacterized protein n=1 Tax=Pongo abelii TaxID=9601 RepID=A0A8I5TGN0_PONAB
MGDEKDSWKVKTLDEILQEKKRRKEQEEKAEIKRLKNVRGELRDHRMEITIRNSPYRREDSMEDRGEEDDSLAIKPPQQMSRKEKAHHRKDEKRKEKRRHRSHSAEGGKHARVKEKEREHERRKRHREEQDKARREWERQKRREMAREHSRRERDRLEQLERKRERERKMREQQKEQREQKERERRAEERRKEREARREVSAHHRTMREDYSDKVKASHWSRSPLGRRGSGSSWETAGSQVSQAGPAQKPAQCESFLGMFEKMEERDLLSDLQTSATVERKTSSAESSSYLEPPAESGSGFEEEEEGGRGGGGRSTSEESGGGGGKEEEEEETGSNSEEASEQSAGELAWPLRPHIGASFPGLPERRGVSVPEQDRGGHLWSGLQSKRQENRWVGPGSPHKGRGSGPGAGCPRAATAPGPASPEQLWRLDPSAPLEARGQPGPGALPLPCGSRRLPTEPGPARSGLCRGWSAGLLPSVPPKQVCERELCWESATGIPGEAGSVGEVDESAWPLDPRWP